MERITQKTESGYYVPPEQQAQALARLGRWEDMTERLEQEQADIAAQLERLRGAGKEKSVRFRELCWICCGAAAAHKQRGLPDKEALLLYLGNRMILYTGVAFRRKVYTNVYIRIKAYLNVSNRSKT